MTDLLVRPGVVAVPDGVVFERTAGDGWQQLRLRATAALTGVATGSFARPSAHVALRVAGEPDFLGFAFTQFALPVVAGPTLDFDFHPAHNLHSPPALGMLLGRVDGRYVWLAPLDHPHEQVIAVADGALRWGWHGDLDDVPAGFSTTLGVFEGDTATEVLERWGEPCAPGGRDGAGRPTPSPRTCRTGPTTGPPTGTAPRPGGPSVPASPTRWRRCVADGVPVRAVELDSWCYEHEVPPADRRDRLPRGGAAVGDDDVAATRRRVRPRAAGRATRSSGSPNASDSRRW